ncbi:MAG TPA: ABC transporter permease [Acidimicrobiales bacterium]|nr:ABC transporter permease [Acidimicrobiales bacterium]
MSLDAPPLLVTAAVIGPGSKVRWLRRNPLLVIGGVGVFVVLAAAVFAPLLAPFPHDAGSATHPFQVLQAPSSAHPFGTDQVGRDILSRVLYGARVSPLIAAIVLGIAVAVGVPLGLIAGYFGGVVDDLVMRVTDIFLAVPALLLALALAAVLTPGFGSTVLAISVTWWPWYARLVRGEAASVRNRRFIENCEALGLPRWRMLLRHVLPNSVTPVLVQLSLDFGGVILTASALSFLGLGVQTPTPDWGLMVSQGQPYFTTAWWAVTFPGLAILFTAMVFNLLGDGLQDLLDPRRVTGR